MSRSSKAALRKTLAVVAGGALCLYAGLSVQRFLGTDPLKRFKGPPPKSEETGVEIPNFDWKAFNGARLVAQAHVLKATVGRDRRQTNLVSVSDGKIWDEGKVAFGFEAENAVYYDDIDALTGTGKSRVFNADMDISTTQFQYDPEKNSLKVTAGLSGKLQGGDVKADTLTYRLADKSFDLTGIRWSGVVAQDDSQKKWSFAGQADGTGTSSHTVKNVTTFGKLKATDGEVIILADGAEYDKETDVLTAKGHVRYFGPDANMVCETAVLYRKDKHVVLTGSVDMLVKPKQGGKAEVVEIPPLVPVVPDEIAKQNPTAPPADSAQDEQEKQIRSGKNLRDYPIAVTAAKIEYWYKKGEKHAVITGSPQALQTLPEAGWRRVWADSGYYDGERETLNLKAKGDKPEVRMLNSLGDDALALSVLVSTKEDDDMMDAEGLTMTISIKESELPEKVKKDGGSTGGGTPPPIRGPIGKRRG